MAVTLNANSTADTTSDAVTTKDNANLTIGAISNTVLIAQLAWSLQTVSGVTVVWDPTGANQSLTLIGVKNSGSSTGRVALYGLVAPITGNKTLRATWTGSSNICLNGVAFDGADQSGGTTTFPNFTSSSGNTNAASLTITSAVNNMTVDCACNDTSTQSHTGTSTQTFLDNNPSLISSGGSRGTGAATVTHTWGFALTSQWAQCGCDIQVFGGAPTVDSNQTFSRYGRRPGPFQIMGSTFYKSQYH